MDRVIAQRYRVIEPIGTGGSSQVYLAHDLTLGRQVALKMLDDSAAAEGDLRQLFTKEARALAQLSHPNVVAVYDVGGAHGQPFIAMEHVEGVSLRERIERTGALTLADALRLASGIAEGLDFAHSRGVVHADLKPANILLDRQDRPKICDFGIARTPREDAETPQLFATALYVSPERVEGRRPSVASDIYGLGLIVYEMLVGKPPFTSASAAVLLHDHVVRQPVPPSHLRPSLPQEVDAIVLKALAKDPALRWRRAGDMAAALRQVQEGSATTRRFSSEQIQAPKAAQSPVVQLLSAHGRPIRNTFFAVLTSVPVLALSLLAGVHPVPSLAITAVVGGIALVGGLGPALVVAWITEAALIFLFVPGLAFLFALMGVVVRLRHVKAERTALALAMPVSAPFGLAPALVLVSASIHGLSGVISVAWGAALTLIFAIASGRQSLGPFAPTGLTLEQESLFGAADAVESQSAFLRIIGPSPGDGRFDALRTQLDPGRLVGEMGGLISRVGAADLTAPAAILAWIVAALAVWTVTRLMRSFFGALLRRAGFTPHVAATALGVACGAMLLYMLFVTVAPLARAPGRAADDILLLSAVTSALLALAAGVVISATGPPVPHEEEPRAGA